MIITGCVSGYHVCVPIEQQKQTRACLANALDAKLTLAGFEHVNTPDFAIKDFGMSPISWRRKVLQSSIQRFWYGSEYVNVYITSTETSLNIGILKTKGSSEGRADASKNGW
jgi:hypothetical protein